MAPAAPCATYCAAERASTCALARSWLAQIALAASCVTSRPATITSVRRPSSEAGHSRTGQRLRTRHADVGREHVAGAAHGLDQRGLLAVVVQAQAQAADLHVERAVERAGIATARFLAQHAAVE